MVVFVPFHIDYLLQKPHKTHGVSKVFNMPGAVQGETKLLSEVNRAAFVWPG